MIAQRGKRSGVWGVVLWAVVLAGCTTVDSKSKDGDSSVSTLFQKSASQEKASPQVQANQEVWKAVRKAVRKALIRQMASNKKMAFGIYPLIQALGGGRYRVFGEVNTHTAAGMPLRRTFDAWLERKGWGGPKCKSLAIDGQRIL